MRAAIYLRLSKEDKQESIENQRVLLRRYANDNGFLIVKEYTDEAISGLTDMRPGFAKMMEDARKGYFDVILAKNQSRFSRNFLQVQHPGLDLFGLAHVPEILAQIAASAARDVHLRVILIAAVGALPLVVVVDDDLPVIAAHLAVVALGVELGVLDVVVDEADDLLQRFQVVAHIGDLHIGDTAAGGDFLELALKGELIEGVDVLPHIHMVAVGVVALVGDVGDGAEALLVDAGEAVAQGLGGGTVQGKADVGLLLPVVAGLPQAVHHPQGEGLSLRIGVGDPLHQLGHLVQADVAQGDGGVAAVQQRLDGRALGQTGNGAVLPVDGGGVGAHILQCVVPAHQGLKTQLEPLVQQLPEGVLVSLGEDPNLGQIEGDHALVEAALKLVVPVCVLPGGQEGAAAHGGEDIALVILLHLLGGDVVGVHPLGGTAYRKLGDIVVLPAL